jgi:glycosyltransferase involved in cell wall biosynthesis
MTSHAGAARISIGMPAYNGERYLRRVIDGHLRQTFTNFELIIADDASTDGTQAICEEMAASDPRIRYVRVQENKGATRNFNRVVGLARGEYFKWSAQDDFVDPTFLKKCLHVLETRRDVVLCHALCKIVDLTPLDQGEAAEKDLPVLFTYDPGRLATDAEQATSRFGSRIKGGRCTELYGLIRLEALRRVNREGRKLRPNDDEGGEFTPFQPFVGADRAVLAELTLDGKFARVDEYLFYNGNHAGRGSASGRSAAERLAFYRSLKEGRRSFPICSLFGAYFDMVRRRVPSRVQRLRCYGHMFAALFRRLNLIRLSFELLNAAAPRLGRLLAARFQSSFKRARAPDAVQAGKPAADQMR